MRAQKTLYILFFAVLNFLILPNFASAWNVHQLLMPWMFGTPSENLKPVLNRKFEIPCDQDDQIILQKLVQELKLSPCFSEHFRSTSLSYDGVAPRDGSRPPLTAKKCGPQFTIQVGDLLRGSIVDDPDHGMDRDFPEEMSKEVDPSQDRMWMGGLKGPSSQGFRHMYFGGWKFFQHPFLTFQIPFRPMGQAPNRIQILSQKARELIRGGNLAWGTRVLGWGLHYLQDLTQPFHTVPFLNSKMVAWGELYGWPPRTAFDRMHRETTRITTNLHWAYEGYVQTILQLGDESPLKDCLVHPEKYSKLSFDPKTQTPTQLTHEIIRNSIELAIPLGESELGFFGIPLVKPGVDFTTNTSMIDYKEYSIRPDLMEARKNLNQATCKALANSSLASQLLVEWAFQP